MASTRPIAELDFDTIKGELITFLRANPTFTDYNFEGSALNAIMDVLAYNTHYNAFYANMLHNESFLDTAQARGSVVSKAKELGYVPASVNCSTAFVNINVLGVSPSEPLFQLSRGAQFSASNDNGSYSFLVSKDYTVQKNGSLYSFQNVELKEGTLLSNIFRVNSTQNPRNIYTIPNRDVDLSTLEVFIRENETSSERTQYFKKDDSFDISSDSNIFFVQESYDGFFQIYFGDGVFGKSPEAPNIIDVSYFVTRNKDTPNGCTTFVFNGGTIGPSQNIAVTTSQNSLGGKEKESIDSVKFNAVKFNQSRNRAVAADDYSVVLKNKFPFIKTVSTYGGQDADPPVYGKVFISIQPESGLVISDDIKKNVIIPELTKNNVLTIIPELIDPDYTFINLEISVKFNKNKTTTNAGSVNSLVSEGIVNYFEENLNSFGKDYIESEFVGILTDLDPGISGISLKKLISARITPVVGIPNRQIVRFNNRIKKGSLTSSFFIIESGGIKKTVFIKDDPSIIIQKFDVKGEPRLYSPLNIFDTSNLLIGKIGEIEYSNPTTNLSGGIEMTLLVDNFVTNSFISLYAETEEDDILVSRNQILAVDGNTRNIPSGVKSGITISLTPYER